MYLGEIVESGPSRELYRHPLHPYTFALLSSVPTLEPKKKKRRIVLTGDVPSPMNPPAGCRFHPRCPLAMAVCRTDIPQPLTFGEHVVRCHAVEQEQVRLGADPAALSAELSRQIADKVHPLAESAMPDSAA